MFLIVSLGAGVVAVSLALTRLLLIPGSPVSVLDSPNQRSLHVTPTPRTGGVAIVVGIAAGCAGLAFFSGFVSLSPFLWLGLAGVAIAGVGIVDDYRQVSILIRLAVHIGAAIVLVLAGYSINWVELGEFRLMLPGWLGTTATVIFVVWMTNLYNFMDGMDGFAAGMAIIGFGTLALFGVLAGNNTYVAVNLFVAAAAGGFLVFNFPPAKIFMGDSGSATLGFLASGMIIWGNTAAIIPLWLGILVFSLFIVDSTVTLSRRLFRGERIWEAHRTHCYQRLVQVGWGHRKTVLVAYVVMFACSVFALIAHAGGTTTQWVVLGFWVVWYTVMVIWIDQIWDRRT